MKRFRSIISPGREKRSRAGGGEGGGERERGGGEREEQRHRMNWTANLSRFFNIIQVIFQNGRKEEKKKGTRKEPGRNQEGSNLQYFS